MTSTNPIQASSPIAGFYKTRLAGKGPWVPAELYLADDQTNEFGLPVWHCELPDKIVTDTVEVLGMWPYLAKNPIDKAEYDYMVANLEHARAERPLDAMATPDRPVDWAGHNMPPSDSIIKAERLLAMHDPSAEVNVDSLHATINLVKQMTVLSARLDEERKQAGGPHKAAQTEAEKPYRDSRLLLANARTDLLNVLHKVRKYLDSEMKNVTTDLGATAFTRQTYEVVINDRFVVPRELCSPNLELIKRALRYGLKVHGAELVERTTTVVT